MFFTRSLVIHKRYHWTALSFALLILPGMFVGCANATTTDNTAKPTPTSITSIPVIPITAVDYGYIMPPMPNLPAGLVDLALVNNGSESHQAQVARLNTGVTNDEVYNALVNRKDQAAAFSLLTFAGGPDTISPGYGQETILDLSAGQYVLLCFVVSPDGTAHVSKGMIHFFTVSSEHSQRIEPPTDATIVMKDFSYLLPSAITQSRALTLRVTNQGSEPHELNIVRLAQGKSVKDILAFFQSPSGPPPFEEMGGLAAITPGASAWISIHLEPGRYAMYSFIPDERTGRSQLTLGMLASFVVRSL